ncbi:hypothetical protein [Yersinia sp. 1652 StPb PI]|uniref:hypothetical protein n=1 Tax=Yersinia sp. 1652 StPb PI TaxID=3061649 RepID=UPI00355B3474
MSGLLFFEAGYGSGVNIYQCADRIPFSVLLWWPALISGLILPCWRRYSGLTRILPSPYITDSVAFPSRISLRIHHIRLDTVSQRLD